MSIKGIHWAREAHVDPYRKALLFALGERHNIDTGLCKPDQVMLGRDAGMSDRTVRKYVRILEAEGFISRGVVRSGTGRETHYILHFDVHEARAVEGVRKAVPDGVRKDIPDGGSGTPVPDPSGTPVPDPSGSCVPVHIRKHESTRRDTKPTSGAGPDAPAKSKSKRKKTVDETALVEAFDRIWTLWPKKGRERSRSKALVMDQLRRSAAKCPPMEIVDAVRAFVARTEERYTPGLDRWLRNGQFEHFTENDLVDRAQKPIALSGAQAAKLASALPDGSNAQRCFRAIVEAHGAAAAVAWLSGATWTTAKVLFRRELHRDRVESRFGRILREFGFVTEIDDPLAQSTA